MRHLIIEKCIELWNQGCDYVPLSQINFFRVKNGVSILNYKNSKRDGLTFAQFEKVLYSVTNEELYTILDYQLSDKYR